MISGFPSEKANLGSLDNDVNRKKQGPWNPTNLDSYP